MWELPIKLAELGAWITIVTLLLRGVKAINRLTFLLENFPPHRHSGNRILYPKGYAPGEEEREKSGVEASA